MSNIYKNPPIIEALCEFKFTSDTWDVTKPGLLYDKIKDEFPVIETKSKLEFGVIPLSEGLRQDIFSKMLIRFVNKENNTLFQIDKGLLALNQLKPYSSWEKFSAFLKKNYEIYANILKPNGLKSLLLKYINLIDFDDKKIELENFFTFYPHTDKKLPDMGAFRAGIQISYNDGRDNLKLEIRSTPVPKPKTIGILFDLEYVLAKTDKIELANIWDWINDAHSNLEKAFETCITDKLRSKFV